MFDPTEYRHPDLTTTIALNALEDAATAIAGGGKLSKVREARREVDAAIDSEIMRRVAEAYAAGLAAQVKP